MKYALAAYLIVIGSLLAYRILLGKECNSLRNLLDPRKK